jgi:hypothetical protein
MRSSAAVLCLLLPLAARAQIVAQNAAFQCIASASVPPLVRAEGLTELVGDVTVSCSGGVPTQRDAPVPQSNIQIFLNTIVTSRLLSSDTWTEALLLIDEPHSTSNPTTPLTVCGDTGTNASSGNPGSCSIFGTGNGRGVYAGTQSTAANCASGLACNARPNVFQGRLAARNSLVWDGVPVDPPGAGASRFLRFTNIRANATQFGVSSTLVPTSIVLYIAINGATSVPLNNPTQVVAFVQRGVTVQAPQAKTYLQCASPEYPNSTISLRIDENFPSAFKKKNVAFQSPSALAYPERGDQNQNVPGAIYNTESGFMNLGPAADPALNPPDQSVQLSLPASPGFPLLRGLRGGGTADHGSRIAIVFTSIPEGTSVYVPGTIDLVNRHSGATTGTAVLTATNAAGAGPFSTESVTITVENGRALAVYEILYSDPFTPERMDVPITVSYGPNPAFDYPRTGVHAQVAAGFAPLGTNGAASASDPVPRFAPPQPVYDLFGIVKCRCSLLFPFVTSKAGYDTGIVVANTSLDVGTEFGTSAEPGTVTLHYFCGQPGCTSPPSQTTVAPIEGGNQLAFTLSGGGPAGIAPVPGFQGYLIAQSTFRFCHGFAYLSALGAAAQVNSASIGYLGLATDKGLNRTGIASENLGN